VQQGVKAIAQFVHAQVESHETILLDFAVATAVTVFN
jgi:hypothetical protein